MKKILLIPLVTLFSCDKLQFTHTVTIHNPTTKRKEFRLDFEKKLTYLEAGESITLQLEGYHHLNLIGYQEDSVFVQGDFVWP